MSLAYTRYGKRVCDVVIAVFLLILLSWFMLIILCLYILTFQFPILFKQPRIGKNGTPFVMYKFRTLSNKEGSLQQRRFALGNFLRVTNLDELPQCWNIMKGEMSWIGPRPLPVEYKSLFSEEQNKRHDVLPGITGLAQISGKNNLAWNEKFQYDLAYVHNVTFRMDCMILLKTLTLVLSMKRDVSLQEDKFNG